MFHVPIREQETVIQFYRNDPGVKVWTSDTTQMNRMDKLVADPDSSWVLKEEGYTNLDGERSLVSKEYYGLKSLITIRAKKRQYTEEQKRRFIENLPVQANLQDSNPPEDN